MLLPKRKHNKNYKRNLSSLTTSGLGLFLMLGFSGCNNDNDCNKNGLYDSKEDCKNSNILGNGSMYTTNNSSSNHTSSGFFAPIISHGSTSESASHSTSHGFSSGG